MVHESALCMTRVRKEQSLSQRGFEVANGLPFVATDQAIHNLLEAHTIEQTKRLQIALGQLRRASGHFQGQLLAIDPHHLRSYTKRQTRRHKHKNNEKALKTLQTFFCVDADTHQPVAFTLASAAKTVSQASPELLDMVKTILNPKPKEPLVLADNEHLTHEIFAYANQSPFDLLAPMKRTRPLQQSMAKLPDDCFTSHWPGLATARVPYRFQNHPTQPLYQLVQRGGEKKADMKFSAFLSTSTRDELDQMCKDFPHRWHAEEFFNAYQAMGWNRAGTLNLNIRYAQLTLALVAQAAVHQLRQRLGDPYDTWEAAHLGRSLLQGLDGDVRVKEDTIVVTFYNAPNTDRLRKHYQGLPRKLAAENVDPRVPWLYGFKLDFRFK
jgi:hypothetical protein